MATISKNKSESSKKQHPLRILYLLLSITVFFCYANTLGNAYNMDDELVTNGNTYTSAGLDSIGKILTTPYYLDAQGHSFGFRPIVHLSFAFEHAVFGASPSMSHLINLLLYLLTALLLFYCLNQLFGEERYWMNFFICLLFVIHPLHTEAVASIKNRDELLCLFFLLASIPFYLRFSKQNWLYIIPAIFLLLLSLLSKKSGIAAIPCICIMLVLFTDISYRKLIACCICLCLSALIIWNANEWWLLVVFLFVFISASTMLRYFIACTSGDAQPLTAVQRIYLSFLENLIYEIDKRRIIGVLISVGFSWAIIMAYYYTKSSYIWLLMLVGLLPVLFALSKEKRFLAYLYLIPWACAAFFLNQPLLHLFLLLSFLSFQGKMSIRTFFSRKENYILIIPLIGFIAGISSGYLVMLAALLFSLLLAFCLLKGYRLLYSLLCLLGASAAFLEAHYSINSGCIYFAILVLIAWIDVFRRYKFLLIFLLSILFVIPYIPLSKNKPASNASSYAAISLPTVRTIAGLPGEGRKLEYIENPLASPEHHAQRYPTSIFVMGKYLRLCFAPYPLKYYYGYADIEPLEWASPWVIVSGIALVGCILLIFYFLPKHRIAAFGLLWMLICLLSISNAPELVAGIMGERLFYIGSIGFCISLIELLALYFPAFFQNWNWKLWGTATKVTVLFCCFVMAVFTIRRNADWKDVFTLANHDMSYLENSAKAHNFLATQHILRSMTEAGPEKIEDISTAAIHFKRAAEIYPYFTNFWYDLGRSQAMLGRWDSATLSYQHAADLDTGNTQLAFDCAYAALQVKNNDLAIRYFQKVIEKEHSNKYAFQQLYNLWITAGDSLSAKRLVNNYSALNPGDSLYFGL